MLETILFTAAGILGGIALIVGLTFVAAAAMVFIAGTASDSEDFLDD
jgi:hypothetical protein